ncbi:hypothetical protein OnM2_050058 [Erysiphe neolycopersici]|uniref:Uncharacterized protein n=1 Tax=Erysiphe neolycopersici TaxID=212602 RepID=A0A420HST5_9PEZI|nr:hypothetical protein OnM2_050058 [Erysiphe neolycopersici]
MMSLKASPKNNPTKKNIPEPQTLSVDGLDICKAPISQNDEVVPEKSNSYTSKLPTRRLVQIGFYDPDDNLISPAKEVYIEANTLLNELVLTLQDLLDLNTAAASRERLKTKSIQLRILDHESYQNFPWPKIEIKDGNCELDCGGKLIWDQLESMDSNWTKSREILLKHDTNLKKIQHSILVVQTISSNENTSSLPGPIPTTDNVGIINRKLEMEPNFKKKDDQDHSAVRIPEISSGTEFHNQKIKDEAVSMKPIDKNKNDIEEKLEHEGNDNIQKKIDKKALTQIENPNRKSEGVGNLKIQEEQEETIASLSQCQIISPSEVWVEEQNKKQTNNILSIENLQLSADIERENSTEQIILSSESTTPCWSDCDEVTENDELLTKNGYFKNREDSHKDSEPGKIRPGLTRDLEKYRRFHESAISYANEDEDAFFPSTPKSITEVYFVDETRETSSKKHQATQLDLDKIVKDAVVRKLNKIRCGYLDPLASPIFNLNEDMIYNQQALYDQGFNQYMNISQEQNELQQLELMYGSNLCEQKDEFFSKNTPAYFMSPSAQDYGIMLGVNTEQQNSLNDYGTNPLKNMSHNLPYTNGAIANYLNNDYNMDNLMGLPYTNPYTQGNPGAYFLNNSYQLGTENSNFNPTYMLKNQMNIPSPLVWNRAHSHGVF